MNGRGDQFRLYSEEEMLAMPRKHWLVDGVIREGTISLIVGQPGSHKSFVALSLAQSVARGEPWAGLDTMQRPVVYVLGERADFQPERIEAVVKEQGTSSGMVRYLMHAVQFDKPRQRQQFVRSLESAGLSNALVIIDTLRNCFGGDENDSRDANGLMLGLRDMQERLGASILLVHHSARTKTDHARGSTAFVGSADHELYLRTNRRKKPTEVAVQARKTNHGKAWLKLVAVPRVVDVSGGLTSVVLDYRDVVELDEFDDDEEVQGADPWPEAILQVVQQASSVGEQLTANAINQGAARVMGVSALSGANIKKKLAALANAGCIEPHQLKHGGRTYYRTGPDDSPVSISA